MVGGKKVSASVFANVRTQNGLFYIPPLSLDALLDELLASETFTECPEEEVPDISFYRHRYSSFRLAYIKDPIHGGVFCASVSSHIAGGGDFINASVIGFEPKEEGTASPPVDYKSECNLSSVSFLIYLFAKFE